MQNLTKYNYRRLRKGGNMDIKQNKKFISKTLQNENDRYYPTYSGNIDHTRTIQKHKKIYVIYKISIEQRCQTCMVTLNI